MYDKKNSNLIGPDRPFLEYKKKSIYLDACEKK